MVSAEKGKEVIPSLINDRHGSRRSRTMELDEVIWRLKNLGAEVRVLGNLLRWYQTEIALDAVDHEGMGELLNRLGKTARRLAHQLEGHRCQRN